MKRRSLGALALVLITLVLLAVCGGDDRTAGGGINNPNTPCAGISGAVTTAGAPTADAEVVLYRITYDDSTGLEWGPVDTAFTDADGEYAFEDAEVGYYSVLGSKDDLAAFGGYYAYLDSTVLLQFEKMLLEIPITVQFNIIPKDIDIYRGMNISFIGAPYSDIISYDGIVNVSGIARGAYQLRIILSGAGSSVPLLDNAASLPLGTYSDSLFTIPTDNIPGSTDGDVDTVAVVGDSISVDNDDFSINYTIE